MYLSFGFKLWMEVGLYQKLNCLFFGLRLCFCPVPEIERKIFLKLFLPGIKSEEWGRVGIECKKVFILLYDYRGS